MSTKTIIIVAVVVYLLFFTQVGKTLTSSFSLSPGSRAGNVGLRPAPAPSNPVATQQQVQAWTSVVQQAGSAIVQLGGAVKNGISGTTYGPTAPPVDYGQSTPANFGLGGDENTLDYSS
jgi:hypothetical protein